MKKLVESYSPADVYFELAGEDYAIIDDLVYRLVDGEIQGNIWNTIKDTEIDPTKLSIEIRKWCRTYHIPEKEVQIIKMLDYRLENNYDVFVDQIEEQISIKKVS